MYVFCKNFIAGYAGTIIAGHVGNAPDDEHTRETMQYVMARIQEIDAYVKSRDSDMSNPKDGFIPLTERSSMNNNNNSSGQCISHPSIPIPFRVLE